MHVLTHRALYVLSTLNTGCITTNNKICKFNWHEFGPSHMKTRERGKNGNDIIKFRNASDPTLVHPHPHNMPILTHPNPERERERERPSVAVSLWDWIQV